MGLLPWSFGFLLIISILSWSSVGRMVEETLVAKNIVVSVTKQAEEITKKISQESATVYRQYCETKGKQWSDDGEFEEDDEEEEPQRPRTRRSRPSRYRKRLTSKFHIAALFNNEDVAQKPTQEKIFRNLLKQLYDSQPLFTPTGSNDAHVQQLFEEVRLKTQELSPKMPMKKASYLANIECTGANKAEKQFILFLILKGGEGEVFRGARCHVRSLLSYISMAKKETCLSVYLAPVPLLLAVFENTDIVEKILETREVIYKKIHEERKRVGALPEKSEARDIIDVLSDEFKNQFEPCLPQGIDPQYLDFRVSSTRPKNGL